MKRKNPSQKNTSEAAALYNIVQPQIHSAYNEVKELSKKNPDGVLNIFKVKLINKLLNDALSVLEKEPVKEYLSLLDEDTLPFNSDANLVLGQFLSALEQFRIAHFNTNNIIGGDWDCWGN